MRQPLDQFSIREYRFCPSLVCDINGTVLDAHLWQSDVHMYYNPLYF